MCLDPPDLLAWLLHLALCCIRTHNLSRWSVFLYFYILRGLLVFCCRKCAIFVTTPMRKSALLFLSFYSAILSLLFSDSGSCILWKNRFTSFLRSFGTFLRLFKSYLSFGISIDETKFGMRIPAFYLSIKKVNALGFFRIYWLTLLRTSFDFEHWKTPFISDLLMAIGSRFWMKNITSLLRKSPVCPLTFSDSGSWICDIIFSTNPLFLFTHFCYNL